MSDSEKLQKLVDRIRLEAQDFCWPDNDDFDLLDYCGKHTGRILFARQLLELLKGD